MSKVFFFSSLESGAWGGSEQLWSDMAIRLAQQGHKVMSNTIEWKERPLKFSELQEKGVKLTFRPNPHIKTSMSEATLNKVKARKWKTAVMDFKPDIVFINQGGSFDNALLTHKDWLLSLNKKTFILTNGIPEYDFKTKHEREVFSGLFLKVEQVWLVSNKSKEITERTLAAPVTNSIVIKNPIKVKDVPKTYPATDTFKMAVVSRLVGEIKGFDYLISTFALPQWKDRNYQVNFYGNGPDKEYLEDLVAYYGLQDKIIFRGFAKNITEIWENNHILLMTSRGEGMPLSLLEANYCKRAAIVTDVGGCTEIITDGENGFVAEAATVNCMAKAWERAWDNRDKWEEMGLNAKKKIDSLYKTDAVDDAIERLGL